jgi:hypothetical protein
MMRSLQSLTLTCSTQSAAGIEELLGWRRVGGGRRQIPASGPTAGRRPSPCGQGDDLALEGRVVEVDDDVGSELG